MYLLNNIPQNIPQYYHEAWQLQDLFGNIIPFVNQIYYRNSIYILVIRFY